MVPNNTNSGQSLVVTEYATRTYRLDITNKKIGGFVDGIEAVAQDAYKKLQTEQYAQIIYDDYGTPLEDLEGQDPDYVKAVLEDRITESLLSDSRVTGIEDFTMTDSDKSSILVTFTLVTIYGSTTMSTEVNK